MRSTGYTDNLSTWFDTVIFISENVCTFKNIHEF